MSVDTAGRTDGGGRPFRSFFGILLDETAYARLAYLLAAFPLGIAYFVVLTVGFSLGTALAAMFVGIPILLITAVFSALVLRFEGRFTDLVVGADVPRVERPKAVELVTTHAAMGVVVLLSKWIFGLAGLILVSTVFGFGLALLTAPAGALGITALTVQFGSMSITSLPAAVVAALIGVPVTVAAFHCCSLFVEAYGRGMAVLYEEVAVAAEETTDGQRRL